MDMGIRTDGVDMGIRTNGATVTILLLLLLLYYITIIPAYMRN